VNIDTKVTTVQLLSLEATDCGSVMHSGNLLIFYNFRGERVVAGRVFYRDRTQAW
jgi:hypothetical protein